MNDWIRGIKKGLPIAIGYLSVSFTFGVKAVNAGIPVWITILISVANVTSAGQFAGVAIMAAHGSYLEMAANYGDAGEDDTIRNLGIKAKNYANKVYHASDDEVDNVISDAEGDFDEFTTKLGNGIDNAVDDFMNFFETKKTNE